MSKYELLPQQLLVEGIASENDFFEPDPLSADQILSTHSLVYWQKLSLGTLSKDEIRKSGFPYSRQLVEREVTIAGGTFQCALYALKEGLAMNIAGGTHHAFTDRGEGFCLLNDIAIAANLLLSKSFVNKVLVVDLDVHQGNGTAQIFSSEERVFTFSMHGAKNYPLQKEKSDLDVPLDDGTLDEEYIMLLEKYLSGILDSFDPDFIFYQSGVDVLSTDKLGRLSLTEEGSKQRDKIVFDAASKKSIPIVACMGGGYSPKIGTIINAHKATFEVAKRIYE